jgi:hypothetical protein
LLTCSEDLTVLPTSFLGLGSTDTKRPTHNQQV